MSTLIELKSIAKKNEVKGYHKMNKADLQRLLSKKGMLRQDKKTKQTRTTTYQKAKSIREKYGLHGNIVVEVWTMPRTISIWVPLHQVIKEGETKWGGHRYTLWTTQVDGALMTTTSFKSLKEAARGFSVL
jgi:hypothetical protein